MKEFGGILFSEGVYMNHYKKGDIVTGSVTGIEKYGIFVSLDDQHSGLIHISEISKLFVKNPADYVSVGEIIKAIVIEDNEGDSSHVKLSIKELDYRISRKKKSKIVETEKGFSTLKSMLPEWIEKKKLEIDKKMKKN